METTSFTYKTGPCSDVLIIGGGLAGMYSALAAAESGAAVRILCKSKTGGSGNSVVAMSVHRFAPDAPGLREDYRRRFLASGAGQQDAEIAAFFVDHAAAAMERLRGLGLPLEYRTLSENGGEFPVYLHMGIQTSPSHSFAVAYMANDAADMDTLMDSGIMESFRITEETYSGPSSPLTSYADVIFSAAGTMLFAVSAWFGLRALMERKKKKQTDIQAGPGGRL